MKILEHWKQSAIVDNFEEKALTYVDNFSFFGTNLQAYDVRAQSGKHQVNSILLFLNFILEGNYKYKEYLDAIIAEAVDLVKGDKTIFDISKDNFLVITKLQEYGEESIKTINKAKIENTDYQKIKILLEQSANELA